MAEQEFVKAEEIDVLEELMEVSRLLRIREHYLMQVGHIKGMIIFTAYPESIF